MSVQADTVVLGGELRSLNTEQIHHLTSHTMRFEEEMRWSGKFLLRKAEFYILTLLLQPFSCGDVVSFRICNQ